MNCAIVIATYNRGQRIRDTIESVLQQSRPVDEFVIVDDGSTDSTASWIRENFPSVAIVEKVNGGTSSARNAGASFAKSDWLIFLDHDDILLPNAVETLDRLLSNFPEAGSGHCDHKLHYIDKNVVIENHHYSTESFARLRKLVAVREVGSARLLASGLYRSLLRGNLLQQPWIVRKEVFQRVGGFASDVRYCEDWDIYLRIAQEYPVVVSDEVISIHRVDGENLHLTCHWKQFEMYERTLCRRSASHSWLQWQENRIVRTKMAYMSKARGDKAFQDKKLPDAWRHYWRSYMWWPFDPMVLARLLLWLPQSAILKGVRRGI